MTKRMRRDQFIQTIIKSRRAIPNNVNKNLEKMKASFKATQTSSLSQPRSSTYSVDEEQSDLKSIRILGTKQAEALRTFQSKPKTDLNRVFSEQNVAKAAEKLQEYPRVIRNGYIQRENKDSDWQRAISYGFNKEVRLANKPDELQRVLS